MELAARCAAWPYTMCGMAIGKVRHGHRHGAAKTALTSSAQSDTLVARHSGSQYCSAGHCVGTAKADSARDTRRHGTDR
eukprot:2696517-Rhodomonas_salina.1